MSERLDASVRVGDLVITPVVQVSLVRHEFGGVVIFAASKRPVALLIRSPKREWRIEIPREEGS